MRLMFWLGFSDSIHLFQVSITETNKQTNKQTNKKEQVRILFKEPSPNFPYNIKCL